jgi:hypothetical protein
VAEAHRLPAVLALRHSNNLPFPDYFD